MIKKICPICDSELKNGNYCSVCRKVVRRPKVEERNYYLNERRPGSRAPEGTSLSGGHIKAASGTASPEENPYYQDQTRAAGPGTRRIPAGLSDYEGKRKTQPVYRPAQGKMRDKKPLSAKKLMLALLLFISAASLLVEFITLATSESLSGKHEVKIEEAPIWELGESEENGEEEYGYEVYELDPDQLRADGIGCDFYTHADMAGESAKALVESFLSGYGGGSFEIVQSDFNKQYVYYDGTESTIYDTCLTYLPGGESAEAADFYSISLGFDTGNGQLHYFECTSDNIDFAAQAAEVFSGAMDQLDRSVSVGPEEVRDGILALQYAEPEDYEDDLWLQGDNWSIYGYKESDGSYYFSVEGGGSNDDFSSDIEIQEG